MPEVGLNEAKEMMVFEGESLRNNWIENSITQMEGGGFLKWDETELCWYFGKSQHGGYLEYYYNINMVACELNVWLSTDNPNFCFIALDRYGEKIINSVPVTTSEIVGKKILKGIEANKYTKVTLEWENKPFRLTDTLRPVIGHNKGEDTTTKVKKVELKRIYKPKSPS